MPQLAPIQAPTLAERLAMLRSLHDPSIKCKDLELQARPFPLAAIVTLYNSNSREYYINYMGAFRNLCSWLAPIELPPYTGIAPTLSGLLCSYQLQQVSAIILEHSTWVDHAGQCTIAQELEVSWLILTEALTQTKKAATI